MKITLIRPNMYAGRSSDAMEPLSLAILAGLTPGDVEIVFYDERLEPVDFTHDTDLVALTVETYTARRAYQIAARFRARGIPVVMGGYHPTFMPEEALHYADAVAIGDGEGLWEQIVRDCRVGRLERIYSQASYPDISNSTPDRRIFDGKRYAPITLVQYGRGCRFACDFCSIHAFYGSSLRQHPVGQIIAELEALDPKVVFFVDDNLFVDVAKAEAFFTALIPLKIRWFCQISIDIAQNPKLLDLMAKSGCFAVLIGFESLNEANLAQMRKKWNLKHNDYAAVIQKIHDRGLMIYGTFVFGYDQDTPDSFKTTLEFAIRSRFFLANFNPLTPTPGARLYDRLLAENRLIYDRWWLEPGYRYGQATFHPRGMTADELTEGCYYARAEFNTWAAIASRAFDLRSNARNLFNLSVFLTTNLISRREIHTKQGQLLGNPAESLLLPEGL